MLKTVLFTFMATVSYPSIADLLLGVILFIAENQDILQNF